MSWGRYIQGIYSEGTRAVKESLMTKDKKPKFSIIVPIYNAAGTLDDCIKSVISQSYGNFELLLIDDGSTDNSNEICAEWAEAEQCIKVLNQANRGAMEARIKGICNASGDYCIFLDADDILDQKLLETINDCIIEHDTDVIIYKYTKIHRNGKCIEQQAIMEDRFMMRNDGVIPGILEIVIRRSDLNNIVCKAVRTKVALKADFSFLPHVRYGEDLLIFIEILKNVTTVLYIDKALYQYVEKLDSVSNTVGFKFFEDTSAVRKYLL